MRHTILPATLAMLAIGACETTIPASDMTDPVVQISINDTTLKVIGSSDPDTDVFKGCPGGTTADPESAEAFVLATHGVNMTFDAASLAETYFYTDRSPPMKFIATANDSGGVAKLRVSFNDSSIGPSNPEGSLNITDLTPDSAATYPDSVTRSSGNTYHYRVVESLGSASDPRTALIMGFTSSGIGSNPLLVVSGEDFSGNSAQKIVLILPQSLCN